MPENRDLIIDRFIFTDESTISKAFIDGAQACYVLELSCRKGDEKGLRAIEPGRYELKFTQSPRFGKETLEVMNVPGRTGIRIHKSNRPQELDGCLAPGMRVNEKLLASPHPHVLGDELSVFDSGKALEMLEKSAREKLASGKLYVTIHGGGHIQEKNGKAVTGG